MKEPRIPSPHPTLLTRVLCVDDNRDVLAALRLMIGTDPSMECLGCLSSADGLIELVRGQDPAPDVVILDATMPGRDPMAVMKELAASCPSTRTIVYSGHNDPTFIDRVRDAGAWGCVSKGEEPKAILRAVHEVAAGRMVWPGRSAGSGPLRRPARECGGRGLRQ